MPKEIVKPFPCKNCECWFYSQFDLDEHKKVCLKLRTEGKKVSWNRSKKNPLVETINKCDVPEIVLAIDNGDKTWNGYKVWKFKDLICRKKI